MAVAGIAMLLLSCGDGAVEPPPPPPAPVATTVSVNPASATLTALEETARFTAEVRDQNGQVMAGAAVTWASSDASVATVDASGLVTAVANGNATITAAAGSISGSAGVTVAQVVSAVAVSPPADTLVAFGDTLRLEAEATDANGHAVAGVTEFEWSSSDTLVAVVDSAGLVTSVGEGTTMVAAAAGDVSGRSAVAVAQSIESVTVSPSEATIGVSDTLRLEAAAFDENGHAVESAAFSWSSSDAGIATVDDSGLVAGVAEGTARISATAGDASGVSEITVENPDRAALVALYQATDGPNWVDNTNWLTDAPLGEWYGVDVDDSGRVLNIDLSGGWVGDSDESTSHGLSGPIPPQLGNLGSLESLSLEHNQLTGGVPPELGNLGSLQSLSLGYNQLTGGIPPELANLRSLHFLSLEFNQLTGGIPAALAGLGSLGFLRLGFNRLTGGVPAELGSLSELHTLSLFGNPLAGTIPPQLGNMSSLQHLNLYSTGVTGGIPPELGNLSRLHSLSLGDNRLTGRIPPELGNLSQLEVLLLWGNLLAGPVPAELGNLERLRWLRLATNRHLAGPLPHSLTALRSLAIFTFSFSDLCAPNTQEFQDWLGGIDIVSGETCETLLSHRDILEKLHEATNGGGWQVATNWLSDAPLDDWHGVTADSDTVTAIALPNNGLSGVLPLEIGGLETLETLSLNDNAALGGELPLEMVRLTALATVRFDGTGACAPASRSFRDWLANVADARVAECPDDHGSDAGTATAIQLGGEVAGELETAGDQDFFQIEVASRGTLTIRTEGGTPTVGRLYDSSRYPLAVSAWGGQDANFALSRLIARGAYYVSVEGERDNVRGPYTLHTSFKPRPTGVRAYLTQTVQSHDFAVPLVAGEDALLRVFVVADSTVTASMPPVRASFYQDSREVHSVVVGGSAAQVPHAMAENDLDATANAVVPGSVITPGTEMVIEVDPDGTLDPALGIGGRIPAEGSLALDIRTMPDFDVTAVPFLWTENPDSSGYKVAAGLTADHELFYETRDWLPVAEMEVFVREAVLVDYDPKENMDRVLDDLALVHAADGASGYYMGVPPWIESGTLGIARLESKVSASRLDGHTIAHEFGHNFSLNHSPCGNPGGVDPHYPYVGGVIGAWGYDFRDGSLVDPGRYTDLMTYCRDFDWISDYSFAKAADYRTETQAAAAARAAGRVLVVRGRTAGGELRLEPAFVLDAPPSLPDERGPYRLVGSDAQGQELFAIGFDMQEVSHPEVAGTGGFTFAIPARGEWADVLAAITLTGPEGSVTLAGDAPASETTTLMLDAATGRIRAILRDLPGPMAIQADAVGAGPGYEILFSRGIPDPSAWRR